MKLDKKQVPQLIVLGALVMICIGYVSFTVMSPKAAAPAAPAKAAEKSTSDSEQAVATVTQEALPSDVFPNLGSTLPRRDPFTPQALPKEASELEAVSRPAPQPVRPAPRVPRRFLTSSGSVPRIDISPVNPFSQASVPTPTPQVTVQPEPDPEFTLTGVIRGSENVVIIRSGNGRYVVKQGQMIDGRYKVLRVSDDGVVLSHKNRRISVKLGGVKNAS